MFTLTCKYDPSGGMSAFVVVFTKQTIDLLDVIVSHWKGRLSVHLHVKMCTTGGI